MDHKNGVPVQAYATPTNDVYGQPAGQHYPQAATVQPPYNPQAYQQPYAAQGAVGATAVAQPYNGPVAQQAVVGQAGNQQQTHVVVIRQGGHGGAVQQQPQTYCCLAWVSCIFCCCPIGLFAIYNAWSVRQKWQRSDFDGAYQASEMAKKASFAAILIGLAWQIATAVYETSTESSSDNNNGSFTRSSSSS